MPSTKKTSSSSTAVKKTTGSKSKKSTSVKKEEVVEEVVAPVEEVLEEEVDENVEVATEAKAKRVVDKESVLASFDSIVSNIEAEVEVLRNSTGKGPTGVKFLKSVASQLKKLKKETARIAKGKNKKVSTNTNSGFKKPVQISSEMRKFANWGDELHSRVDVTKFICAYVKENDLQKPEDRRLIKPDKKLQKLFNIPADRELKYCDIQTLMKSHLPTAESK